MAAAYEVTLSLTDSESFRFAIPLVDESGAPLDLTGKTFEYALDGCGLTMRLGLSNGLSVDLVNGVVTVAPDPAMRLSPGTYAHGFRSTDANSITIQHFDGEVSVSKGGF